MHGDLCNLIFSGVDLAVLPACSAYFLDLTASDYMRIRETILFNVVLIAIFYFP